MTKKHVEKYKSQFSNDIVIEYKNHFSVLKKKNLENLNMLSIFSVFLDLEK